MKLHLPLRLRYSLLTLLAASVPCFSTSAFAEDITVNSGETQKVTAINGGNVTLGENATLRVVDETRIIIGGGKQWQLHETQAIIGTLTLANGSVVDSRGTEPVAGIIAGSTLTDFKIDTINLLAGASSSIYGKNIDLGDIVKAEGDTSSLSITSYGNITFNAGSVSDGVQLHLKGNLSLTEDSTNSGSLVTEDLTHSGNASLTGTGALTVTGTTTLTGSTLTIANSRQINLDTVNGTGRLKLGDNVLTDGAADTYVSINSVSSGTVYIQKDATLELADGATVGSTLVVNGNLLGTSIELTEDGKISLYGGMKAAQVDMKTGSQLVWFTSGSLQSAIVSGDGDAQVVEPALVSMNSGSVLAFLKETGTNPITVTLNADVKGHGRIVIGGTHQTPTGESPHAKAYVTIEGVLQAGDANSNEAYSGFYLNNLCSLTVGTGDWTKGQDSLDLYGNSYIDETGTLTMKYGRLKLNEGASLSIAGTFNFQTLGEADVDAFHRCVYLGNGAELVIDSENVQAFKSVDGTGKLVLDFSAMGAFEIDENFTGTFDLTYGSDLTVGGTTTLTGDSYGKSSNNYKGYGNSVLTTETLTHQSDVVLSKTEVHAKNTVLADGKTFTLKSGEVLQLGDISGTGTLELLQVDRNTSTNVQATSVNGSHVMVGDDSTFIISGEAGKESQFTVSYSNGGTGTVVLGDGVRTGDDERDTLVSSSSFDIYALEVKGDASLKVSSAGNITSLTVAEGGDFSMFDGTAFTLGTVTNNGTMVLGNGELTDEEKDTVVTMSAIAEIGQLQVLRDASLKLQDGSALKGTILNDGAISCTTITAAQNLTLSGTGSLDADSLTINEGITVGLNGTATIDHFVNSGILQLGDGELTDGKLDTVLDLSAASAPYTVLGGTLQIGRDAALITGDNNTLVISGNSTIAGGLQAGDIRLAEGVTLTVQDSTDVEVSKITSETRGTDTYLVLGSGAAVENGQYTTKAKIDELEDINLTVNRDAELVISQLTLKGELNNAGYINGSNGGVLRLTQDATLTGSGRVHFAETQLAPNPTLTVKNITEAHLGRIYGPTLGRGKLVLGDGESESGFDTIVTADSVEAYHLTVNSDTQLTTQFLSLQGNGSSRTFTINGLVTTDYIAPWFEYGSLRLNAADFEKITVNKGAKLYANTSLELQNVSLSFESVEQMDTTKGWGTLKLGDGTLTDGKKDTTLSVSGVFDAEVEVSSDAALTVTNTANLYNRYNYIDGSLAAANLNLNDNARVIASGYLNVTGETTLGTGSRLELTGSREMDLGVLKGAGTLVLGNGDAADTTSVTVSSFEGMLDIKSDAGLNVSGATTLLNESANAGTLQTNSLTLTESALLNNSGTIVVETGVISLNTDSTLALTGVSSGLTASVSGTGTLQVGDGDEAIRTTAELPDFRGLLDIKSDGALTTSTTTLISVQKDENSLVIDSFINGSLTTQNLNIEGKVNLSGAGTLLVQSATTLAENATLNLWGSEKLSLGAVNGTSGSTLALGTSGTTSAVATSFNCPGLMLAGDTTFTVSGDFTADTVDMGPEAGATLHVQNGKVSLNDIGNAYGLQTGTLILGDGERRLVTAAQGDTPAVTEADTIAAVNDLNLSTLELKSDATLSMTGNGDFKTGTIAMEEGALLDLTISGPIIELGTVTGTGKLVLGAEKRATATSFESALDIGSGATMTVESSYTGALSIGAGATMKVSNEQSGTTTLTGESTNAGTLYSRILELKDKASLSGDGYLTNVNTIRLESGTRLNLTNSARPEGTVIGGFDPDTMALNTISGKGAFVMYGGTKVMADSFEGCLGMRTGSTLIVDGKTTLSGVGAGYGTLVTRELVIARNSGFETHYKDALPTSYDYDGEGSNPAVSLTLNLEAGSYLHMYKTAMQDFLNSMTNASITLNTDSVFYGYGNLHIDQGIMDKFALLEGKIQVSGIITYDSTLILTGCEGLFEGGVSDPSTAEVFSGDVSGDPSGGELPEAQEVPNDVADEIVQEEFNDGVEPDYEPDLEPDTPDIDPGGGEGGPSAGEVIEGIADAAAITGGAAGIVATGLKTYGKVKAAKYAAAVAVIGIAGGTLTEIVLALTDEDDGDDDDDDDDVISIIENSKELTIVNTSIVTGNSDVLSAVAAKARELKESGELEKLSEYVVVLDGNTEVEIKEQLAAWFPEFSELEDGEICFTSPKTSLTGSVVLSGSDITFKGYHEDDEKAKEFNYDRMGDSLTFDKGKESRTTKVISKGTLRLRADDTNVREGTILAAPDVDIKAETLEVSGDSYIVSTKEATLNVSDTTEVSGSTVSLRGVTDGSTLGKLVAKDGARVVLEGSSGSTVKADSVQLNASKLTVKNMNAAVSGKTTIDSGATLTVADATYNTKSMEVKSKGTLVNDNGTISSTDAIVVNGGIVQGSGTFSAITLNSGKLLVNNSSGQMNFTGDLVLGDGEIRFSVDGFEAVAPDYWENSVCSSVNMGGQDFIFASDSVLEVGFCGNTLDALATAGETGTLTFSLTLVQNVGNVSFFTEEVLAAMLENTQLLLTPDTSDSRAISMNGEDITGYAHNLKYSIETGNSSGTCNIVLSGSFSRVDVVPEPTTATLSLLALAGLALRRRRK